MKNPLNKRFKRELKNDFGKYIAIFLFLSLFIGIISGFIVSDNSVFKTYNEGFEKYNIEDGHMTFTIKPTEDILGKIEKENNLTFYNLYYKNETVENIEGSTKKTVRIYANREKINTVCLMSGNMPERSNEIAIDRLFAQNNNIKIGSSLVFNGNSYIVTGFVALPDYSCLFENNSDMMFSAINFGVGITTDEGFNSFGDSHISYNYAWKYNTAYTDETEQNTRSEALIDSLEDIITDYDEVIIQNQVNAIWDDAKNLSSKLEKEFAKASEEIEKKVTDASAKVQEEIADQYEPIIEKAISSLSQEEIFAVLQEKSGLTEDEIEEKLMNAANLTAQQKIKLAADSATLSEDELIAEALEMAGLSENDLLTLVLNATGISEEDAAEALLEQYCNKNNTTVDDFVMAELGTTPEALVAKKLGTTEKALKDMNAAVENAENLTDGVEMSEEAPKIDLRAMENDEDYNSGIDFSFDEIYNILDKVDTTGIYDTSAIREIISQLEDMMDIHVDDSEAISLSSYLPRYQNQAIKFTGDDMGSDKASFLLIGYLVVIIIAFVFAVTTSGTIEKEAKTIGTLRASGYSRGELIRHYLVLPVAVTLVASIVGNILGYTVFENVFEKVYFDNYSLATYESYPSSEAFLETTIVPIILMIIINLIIFVRKMRIRPLDFLRGEFTNHHRKKAIHLSSKLSLMQKFRLRILFQNIPAYIVLFIGILFGGTMLVVSMMFGPLLDDYSDLVQDTLIAKYQYMVTDVDVKTENEQAEKFCATTLVTDKKGYVTDEVTVYGINKNSAYITEKIPDGEVLVSEGFMIKFGYNVGDEFTLKEQYSNKTYTFKIAGSYNYQAALTVFMNRDEYLELFDKSNNYFTGYFSNEELKDIDSDDIAATVAFQDLTKIVDQMKSSILGFMDIFMYLGLVIFVLLMYILTKQILEKSSQSIAMSKILGFSNVEIGKLYLVITSFVVLGSLILSIPVISLLLKWIFQYYMYTMMSGYIPYIISNTCYIKLVIIGFISYIVVAAFMLLKIRKVPKGEALKAQNL